MRVALILNGPPGCGKDYLAEHLVALRPLKVASFKEALFDEVLQRSGIAAPEWFARYHDRELKDSPWHKLPGNMTQRQYMIHVSEKICKPHYGPDYFGLRLADRCRTFDHHVVIPDGGFTEELDPLRDVFGQVLVVQIKRQGCDFSNDSRRYIRGDHTITVENITDQPPLDTILDAFDQALSAKCSGM